MSNKQLNELFDQGSEPSLSAEPAMNTAPISNAIPQGETDREGAMAKADLYKLAKYASKLYKKLDDDAQMEAWVQAKITKAADYVASVYHYLEYEMKFSNYGHKLDNAEMMNEEEKIELRNKLIEARTKIAELKKLQAQKLEEGKSPKAKKDYDKDGKIESEKDEVIGSRRKAAGLDETVVETSEEKKKAYRDAAGKDMQKAAKEGDKDKVSKRLKGVSASLKEGDKPDFLDLDKDGNKKEPMKKAAKEKKCDEAAPSAGLSKKEKSATVKKAKAGGDIGKPGKGFKKLAANAAEKYGSKEKGEKVAAAAMWKNIKNEEVVVKEAVKKAKKDYDGDGKIESGKDEYLGSKDNAIKAAKKEKECVQESADLNRVKEFLTRLNG